MQVQFKQDVEGFFDGDECEGGRGEVNDGTRVK
jgi:hypothetical protein